MAVRATKELRLYVDDRPQSVRIVEGYHAREFLEAVGFALARCGLELNGEGDGSEQLAAWKQLLSNDDEGLAVRVGDVGSRVFDASGKDLLAGRGGDDNPTLGTLLGADGAQKKPKKSKKKAKAKDEDDTSSQGQDASSPGFTRSLEYGAVCNVELLASLSPSASDAGAPVVSIPTSSSSRPYRWQLDVLVAVPLTATVSELLASVRNSLLRQLEQLTAAQDATFEHFPLLGAAFPLTLRSPDATLDVARLHSAFLQPTDRPVCDLERGCSLAARARELAARDTLLFNVHEGIPPPAWLPNATVSLVDGDYAYYHYLQQGERDQGWGCAYRSLQTLASWLRLNLLASSTTLETEPTLTDIQRALVRIGDKPATFVGSREWIGSLEVGYVLDELLGVSFRSLSVPSGSRLPELAPQLAHHFAESGAPVMIGGGQLAFTLLGVAYDSAAGDCAFLVLDPHYTGKEQLDVIQTKTLQLEGYKAVACGWRKASAFQQKCFYNLCLPQRPPYAPPTP